MHTKSQPAAVMTRREQQEATFHCGSEFEKQIFCLMKEASYIVLICDSTGRSEFWDKFHSIVVAMTAK